MLLYNLLILLVCLETCSFCLVSHVSSAPPNPQSLLVLNCLVLGETCNEVFPVEIAMTKSVGVLKEVIKEKNSCLFNHVDARELVLWNVSKVVNLNLEKPLEKPLEKAKFLRERSLLPLEKLSKVFPNTLVESRLHIMVGPQTGGKESFSLCNTPIS